MNIEEKYACVTQEGFIGEYNEMHECALIYEGIKNFHNYTIIKLNKKLSCNMGCKWFWRRNPRLNYDDLTIIK